MLNAKKHLDNKYCCRNFANRKSNHTTNKLKLTNIMEANNNAANNGNNNVNNAFTAKALKEIRKDIANYVDSFKNACRVLLEVADSNKELKRLNAYLGLTAEAIKEKNIGETRKNILGKLPYYYTIEGSETHFPARLRKVNADMQAAGVPSGYIAVKDTYLNALITLGGVLSKGNRYEQHSVILTETDAITASDMTMENTTCVIYDKNGCAVTPAEKAYIIYKQAKKEAAEKAKTAGTIAYANALK